MKFWWAKLKCWLLVKAPPYTENGKKLRAAECCEVIFGLLCPEAPLYTETEKNYKQPKAAKWFLDYYLTESHRIQKTEKNHKQPKAAKWFLDYYVSKPHRIRSKKRAARSAAKGWYLKKVVERVFCPTAFLTTLFELL